MVAMLISQYINQIYIVLALEICMKDVYIQKHAFIIACIPVYLLYTLKYYYLLYTPEVQVIQGKLKKMSLSY